MDKSDNKTNTKIDDEYSKRSLYRQYGGICFV